MAKAPSISASVIARASRSRRGPPNWYDLLPAEVQEELRAIKTQWRSGEVAVEKNTLAKAIRAELTERGFAVVQAPGIVRWLDADAV